MITKTFTEQQLFDLRSAASDAASYWFDIWKECCNGKRTDITSQAAAMIMNKYWKLYESLKD